MSTTKHETEITADPTVPIVRIVREFDATPGQVFRAHTDADLLARWLGPRDLEMDVLTFDCRTGGEYRYVHRRRGEEYHFHGCFHEVTPSRRIVQTFTFEGMPEAVALETMTIEDLGGGRCRLTGESLCDSFEGRDAMLASGMETGIVEGYERLDELIATGDAG
jgi:uncharacterized protein YndB with AHSA1/START domain